MTSTEIFLLTDPHPCRHIVYPYADEKRAVNALHVFAGSGLSKGESVVLIMADPRCEPVRQKLAADGFDLTALEASGQIEFIRAEDMLPELMRDGMPDETHFKIMIGEILRRAKVSSPAGKVRVFGELACLLFRANNVAAAGRLEELWNDMIESCSVALLCIYALDGDGRERLPESLLNLHSHDLSVYNLP